MNKSEHCVPMIIPTGNEALGTGSVVAELALRLAMPGTGCCAASGSPGIAGNVKLMRRDVVNV